MGSNREVVANVDQRPRFGAFVPQGWKQEHADRSGSEAWGSVLDFAGSAVAAGYDGLWVFDHLETYPDRLSAPLFDPWVTLAGLAQFPTVDLGVLVSCVSYRSVSQLAKQAACVDVLAGGNRIVVGLGAGWDEDEYARHGVRYGSPRERVRLLEETAAALTMLWSQDDVYFDGEYVQLAGATCAPRPISPSPPLLIGGDGERHTLRIAAERADMVNWQIGLDQFQKKSAVLRQHCERADRDFDAIERTHSPNCLLFESRRDYDRWLTRPDADRSPAEQNEYNNSRGMFIGTVEDVAEVVSGYHEAGCRGFQIYFSDGPHTTSAEAFMSEVVPMVGLTASGPIGNNGEAT